MLTLKEQTDIEIDRALYKKSFALFFKAAWPEIEADELLWRWYQNYICQRIQAHVERFLRREKRDKHLIICVPPRSSKSKIVSVCAPAWIWSIAPHVKILTASYASRLAMNLSIDTKRLINTNWYQERWGALYQISSDKANTNTDYSTTAGGQRYATSVDSAVTGFGGDILIGDDLLNPFDGYSQPIREATISWMRGTFAGTRLNVKERGFFIFMQQRVHENDPVGWLLKNMPEKFEVINIPAELRYNVQPPELSKFYVNGLMDEVRFSAPILNDIKAMLTPADYDAQFGQAPNKAGGNMISGKWFVRYNINEVLESCDRENFEVVINFAGDTAYTKNQSNSATVVLSCFVFKGMLYITNCLRVFEEITDLVSYKIGNAKQQGTLEKFCYGNGCSSKSLLYIEPKASGKDIIATIKKFTGINVVAYELKTTDKVTSLRAVLPMIKAGRVAIPEAAPWVGNFIEECEAFKDDLTHDKDDQVDTLVMLINMYLLPALNIGGGAGTYSSGYKEDWDEEVKIWRPDAD